MSEKKGFARLEPERLKEISSLGGRTTQAGDNAHRFTSETGRQAAKLSRATKFTSESGKQAAQKSAEVRKEKAG